MIATTCPECDGKLVLKDEMAGRRFTCPDCSTDFRVPRPGDNEGPQVLPPSRVRRFFARHWELLACIGVCAILIAVYFLVNDTVLTSLMPALVLGTIGYAAFYRRLVHPFLGLLSILILVIVGAKMMEKKAGDAMGNGLHPGDALQLLQGAGKNLREMDKMIQDITDGK
jgi:hypothetical protein